MSRPRVTITLGHSGQVVKHAGADRNHLDRMAVSGTKRPIQERLGSNFPNPLPYGNQQMSKRRRSDDYGWDSDAQSGQEDLRLKLIRKNSSRRQRERVDGRERINADLREKLSRTGRSSASIDVHSRIPDPRAAGFVGRIPPTRSADDLLQMDSMRRSYSAWDMNELRRKSPERSLIIPRGISPPANMDELRRLQSMRNDTSRQLPLHSMRNATSRPLPFTNKAPMSFQPTKPVVRLSSTSVVNGPKPSCLVHLVCLSPSEHLTDANHSLLAVSEEKNCHTRYFAPYSFSCIWYPIYASHLNCADRFFYI